jgi:micrococcal nuclease
MLLAACGQSDSDSDSDLRDRLERVFNPGLVSTLIVPTPGPRTRAEVTQVLSGDTIEVSFADGSLANVRYAGINIENGRAPGWVGEPCLDTNAIGLNRTLVEKASVYLEEDITHIDADGRLPRYVYLESGEMVNLRLIEEGYAITSARGPDTKYIAKFRSEQANASATGRGIWRICPPPRPVATP